MHTYIHVQLNLQRKSRKKKKERKGHDEHGRQKRSGDKKEDKDMKIKH